jgi:proteasome lid subunit RPN8/RPN11
VGLTVNDTFRLYQHDAAYQLDERTRQTLIDHARSDFPYEVCGLIAHRADGSHIVYPITNAERSMTYYAMDPRELLTAMRLIEDRGDRFTIYHSHTHSEAYPSTTDIRLAAYPEATYLIVTLQDSANPAMRAFAICDQEVTEKPILFT